MAKSIPDESLDICFIDSDHLYKAVKKDIQSYYPKVKIGGIICGHDCEIKLDKNSVKKVSKESLRVDCDSICHWGVAKAVYEFFGDDFEIVNDGGQGSKVWIHYKKNK